MALQKQSLSINFAQGLDTKTDEFQIAPGRFSRLVNTVFDKTMGLYNRNGFGQLPTPTTTASYLTTFSENLVGIESNIQFFSDTDKQWVNKGSFLHTELTTIPVVRTAIGQINEDIVIDSQGLGFIAYTNTDNLSYYRVFDSITGQTFINQVALSATARMPRVFLLGAYFVVTYLEVNSLKWIAITRAAINNTPFTGTLSGNAKSNTTGYDGFVTGNILYLALNGNDGGGAIRVMYLTSTLQNSAQTVVAGFNGDLIAVTTQTINSGTTNVVVSFWDDASNDIRYLVTDVNLVVTLAPTLVDNQEIIALTTSPLGLTNNVSIFYQVVNSYPGGNRNDLIRFATRTLLGAAIATGITRTGVGIASKPVFDPATLHTLMVAVYGNVTSTEPTYFLIDDFGNILAKFGATNASGYPVNQIQPQMNLTSDRILQVGFLFRDFAVPVNKTVTDTSTGLFTSNGVNFATISLLATHNLNPSEIAGSLILCGGITTMYDGSTPVELGFSVYPEDIVTTVSNGAGTLGPDTYFYYVTYEWTDAQGNIHRSAPSIPITVEVIAPNDTVTLQIPTLRLTSKIASNPVRIVIYRQSVSQPIPYQVTSVTSPLINDSTQQTATYIDVSPDSAIIGNPILYTFGGIVENIGPPPSTDSALFKSRLFLVDSENENLLWYSKTVIQNTPVEMSDLLTQFIQPNAGIQGNTGRDTRIFPMDDKLIIFKKDFLYYMTGNGPDNTGANNDFSEPALINATVGCNNKNSIVFMPKGIIFQSDKGLWLLGRDLSTNYIGADVEAFNDDPVLSAITVPGTNQVRFTMQSGTLLMYDYFYNQWGQFEGIPGISSVVYQGLHTYIDPYNRVFQESPGVYMDQGGNPTLLDFVTNWYSLAGIPGYQRFYNLYLLGQALSPFLLSVGISYDYNDSIVQTIMITPDNVFTIWGGEPIWGDSGNTWGGSRVFERRVFPEIQKCQSFRLTVQQLPDRSSDIQGAGLSLSRMNLILGSKLGYPKLGVGKYAG